MRAIDGSVAVGALLSCVLVLSACSSGESDDQGDLSALTPEETRALYLETVCDAGNSRLIFGLPVQSFLDNGVGDLQLAEESLADAITRTRRAGAVLTNDTAPWPDEIREDVQAVGKKENAMAEALDEFFSGLSPDELPEAYEAFRNRPDEDDSNAGSRVRDFYNLGETGACPRGPEAETLYSLLVTTALPSLTDADQEELLSAGRDICALTKGGLDSEELIVDELSTRGISPLEVGVLVSGAEQFLCPPNPIDEPWTP